MTVVTVVASLLHLETDLRAHGARAAATRKFGPESGQRRQAGDVAVVDALNEITAANTVIMQISVENGSAGVAVLGNPSSNTQRAITRVQVSDGTTTIMGGIFISAEQSIVDRTPGLYRLPLLGWLFKRTNDENESRELLIFITPRILKG